MTRFLLVHGSCHGAWCWRHVIPALEKLGHSAIAIDLPSHGADATPLKDVTLDSYRDAVLAAASPQTVIVGHSMAGYPISAAAEQHPDQMARLIYLCAYVPKDGVSLADMRTDAPYQPLLPAIRKSSDGLSFTIDPSYIKQVFYHDCPPETLVYAGARLCPQAIRPQATPLKLTHAFQSVPKSYIRCKNDGTIPPEFQTTMTKDWPERDVYDMDTGHSPFFADPNGLAQLLDRIVKGSA
jgi:pimeloyl-ACP methyl ester carboxylesterase